jgi:hypothetical protein
MVFSSFMSASIPAHLQELLYTQFRIASFDLFWLLVDQSVPELRNAPVNPADFTLPLEPPIKGTRLSPYHVSYSLLELGITDNLLWNLKGTLLFAALLLCGQLKPWRCRIPKDERFKSISSAYAVANMPICLISAFYIKFATAENLQGGFYFWLQISIACALSYILFIVWPLALLLM